jgi:hypothetical protein
MTYLLAVLLGLIMCVESFASEVTRGNIVHLKNDREPNAGAALFPLIPAVPLLFVGFAWILQVVVPLYSIWILIGFPLVLSVFWAVSFAKLRLELKRTISVYRDKTRRRGN